MSRSVIRSVSGWPLVLAVAMAAIALAAYSVETGWAEDDQANKLFFPSVYGPPPAPDCNIPNTNYTAFSIVDPMSIDAETDPDLNLSYRGYVPTSAPLALVTYAGKEPDTKAPQLPGMFGDNRVPAFTNTYQRYRWNPDCDCPLDTYSKWPVTVLGMGVAPGETIYTPNSGYDIGGGYEYVVMYAGPNDITLHIGIEDDFAGYAIHVDGVCTDPDLLALYQQLDAAGRGELPVLKGHQAFGKAIGSEIQVATRDSGSFMDPRSRNDWWQGR
jgi:hypothetical protein